MIYDLIFTKLFLFLFFVFCYLSFATASFAHVLKTDGEIGAVVHIDPEDDPIVGQETMIYFDVKDKSGRFKIEDCDCQFIVKKAGQEVFSESLSSLTAEYSFPEKNIYTLELVGNSKNGNSFQKFTLSYDLRVEREEGQVSNQELGFLELHLGKIIFGVLALIAGFIIYLVRFKK